MQFDLKLILRRKKTPGVSPISHETNVIFIRQTSSQFLGAYSLSLMRMCKLIFTRCSHDSQVAIRVMDCNSFPRFRLQKSEVGGCWFCCNLSIFIHPNHTDHQWKIHFKTSLTHTRNFSICFYKNELSKFSVPHYGPHASFFHETKCGWISRMFIARSWSNRIPVCELYLAAKRRRLHVLAFIIFTHFQSFIISPRRFALVAPFAFTVA